MSKYQSSEYVQDSGSDSETEVPQFTPPAGFKKYDPPAIDTGKLKQKELWLIKCPKGVDFSKLKTLPVSFQIGATTDVQVGEQTLSLAEDIYQEDIVATQSKSGSAKHVLLAQGKKGKKIQPLSTKIQRYYTISEKVVIPDIDYAKATVPREDVPKEENLRMRHFPTGYGKDDYEEARAVATTSASHKRKSEASDSPKKKAKKEKKDKKDKKDKKEKKKERS